MILWIAAAALAADPTGDVTGDAEIIGWFPSDFPLDADGRTAEWGPALDTELRLGAHGELGNARAEAEVELIDGLVAGDVWSLSPLDERGRDEHTAFTDGLFEPRKLSIGYRAPWFDVEAGLTTSVWGLGMVANDGAEDSIFGEADFGDRVLRLRLATAPIQGGEYPLYVLAAGDRVVEDELATMESGDVAWQALAAVLYAKEGLEAEEDLHRLGVYGAWRDQVTGDGRVLRAGVVDGYGDWSFDLGDGPALHLAGEAAFLGGRTDVARVYLGPDELAIRQGGAVIRVGLDAEPGTIELRGAWASGDGSTDDGVIGDFRFDRDLDVGLVLFDEIGSQVDLAAMEEASDPSLGKLPPDGIESLAAEGAFHAAAALQPVLVAEPVDWLELRAGGVFAWSTQPIADPLQSFRAGGAPRNHLGRVPTGRYLGSELDWAAKLQGSEEWAARPSLEVQGGHAWASRAYGETGRVDEVMIVAEVER